MKLFHEVIAGEKMLPWHVCVRYSLYFDKVYTAFFLWGWPMRWWHCLRNWVWRSVRPQWWERQLHSAYLCGLAEGRSRALNAMRRTGEA